MPLTKKQAGLWIAGAFLLGGAMGAAARDIGRTAWRRIRPVPHYNFRTDPRVVLDLGRQRLQYQLAFADALDTKIGTMFAAGSAVVGLLAAVFVLQESRQPLGHSAFGTPEVIILALALFFYAVVVVTAAVGLWVEKWEVGPSLEYSRDAIQTEPSDEFMAAQIEGYIQYARRNSGKNTLKRWAFGVSQTAVTLETLCVVAAVWRITLG